MTPSLILGGARSGTSVYAEGLAIASGRTVVYHGAIGQRPTWAWGAPFWL